MSEEKGTTKNEMLERFQKMGIPMPMEPIRNPHASGNPEKMSKLDQIRNGGFKNQFAEFAEISERTSSMPSYIPVPKVGKNPNEKSTMPAPKLESFAPKRSSEASMYENALFGDDSPSRPDAYQPKQEMGDFGPTHIDTRAKLQERLNQRQEKVVEAPGYGYVPASGIQLTEAELTEKITKIAQEEAKKMIKSVLMEVSKSESGIIFESKTVKKAEIVGKNKVKIAGVTYELKKVVE